MLLFKNKKYGTRHMSIICNAKSPEELMRNEDLRTLVEDAQASWDELIGSLVKDILKHFERYAPISRRNAQLVAMHVSLLRQQYDAKEADGKTFSEWSSYILGCTNDFMSPPKGSPDHTSPSAALSWRHNDFSENLQSQNVQNLGGPQDDSGYGSSGIPAPDIDSAL